MSNEKRVLVFGKGRYFEAKRKNISGQIIGFIDNYNMECSNGICTYRPNQIGGINYDAIYVMGTELNFIEMVYNLLDVGVSREKIIIGQNLKSYPFWEEAYMTEEDSFFIDENNKLCYKTGGIELAFYTYDEFYGIRDVFHKQDYECWMQGKAVVIDVGMNVGAASIYLARKKNVEKVYSFEPFEPTYKTALYNIKKNKAVENKIVAINAGLGAEKAAKEILYNSSMTCGLSTDEELNKRAQNMYKEWELYRKDERKMQVQILDAAEIFADIFQQNPKGRFILKLDCEGAEYEILRRLREENLLKKISMVMMEWHYNGDKEIRFYLEDCGFAYFSFPKDKNMGNIYAIRQSYIEEKL